MSRTSEAVANLNQSIADAVDAWYAALDDNPELARRWNSVMDRSNYTHWGMK